VSLYDYTFLDNSKKLITEFISLAKTGGNKILLTTHSPYILGTINNLLYANKISKKVDYDKLRKIIHNYKWLDIEKVSAYYVEYGDMQSCLDEEFQAINNEVIDGASEKINSDYEKMVELSYNSGLEGR